MPEKPLTLATLTEFHRRVIVPDIQRIVDDAAGSLRNDMHTLHDSVLQKIGVLETEYAAISVALERIEERQDHVDARLAGLEEGVGSLGEQVEAIVSAVHRLEERLAHVEARLEEIASDGERATMRAEVERLRVRVEALHDEIRRIERRIASSEEQ